jgi:anaerobic ribonucleoside-triphosphate reductase
MPLYLMPKDYKPNMGFPNETKNLKECPDCGYSYNPDKHVECPHCWAKFWNRVTMASEVLKTLESQLKSQRDLRNTDKDDRKPFIIPNNDKKPLHDEFETELG